MNSLKLSGAVVALSILLSGCNTVSQTAYENEQAAISGSATLRKKAINNCIAGLKPRSKIQMENMAALMNVPAAKTPAVYCTRVVNGVANGRLTYADYLKTKRHKNYVALIKVLQGR